MADSYYALFRWISGADGRPRVLRGDARPTTIPCPTTGRQLRISTVDTGSSAICPACGSHGHGAFASFEGDLRMAYACPDCRQVVWLPGA